MLNVIKKELFYGEPAKNTVAFIVLNYNSCRTKAAIEAILVLSFNC